MNDLLENIISDALQQGDMFLVYPFLGKYVAEIQRKGYPQITRYGNTPIEAILNLSKEIDK